MQRSMSRPFQDRGKKELVIAPFVVVTLLWAIGSMAQTAAESRVERADECRQSPRMHALDFWVGEWDVFERGRIIGTNSIEKALEQCAILERWQSVQGNDGLSLFYYDQSTDRWKQVWITDRAFEVGGTKEKVEQVEFTSLGRIRFQGHYPDAESGSTITDRTTLTLKEDGIVRQLIEISTDAGQTWRAVFEGIYRPSTAATRTRPPPQYSWD